MPRLVASASREERTLKILPVVLIAVVAPLTLADFVAADADSKFEKLAAAYIEESPAYSPVGATYMGDHRYDGELDEVSAEARKAESDFIERTLGTLEKVDRAKLSSANQVDAAMLENALRQSIWNMEVLRNWEWNPTSYTNLAGGALYTLMAREYAPLPERLMSVAARSEQIPRLLAQVRETLVPAKVPTIHAETAVRQNQGVISILDNLVVPHLDALEAEDRARLEAAIEIARAAVEEHQTWLEEELLPNAAGDFRVGRELYDAKLAFALHSPLSRKEIRARADSELLRVRDEMYEVSKIAYKEKFPYTRFPDSPDDDYKQAIIRTALEMAYADRPARGEVLDAAKAMLDQATEFVREKNLVTIPDDPIEIIVMPEFQQGVSIAYCDPPGALDAGQKTFYAVSPIPEDWTEEQVESFLREYNVYSMQDLTIHEGTPGHYLQLALSNRYPSTLRAVLYSGSFVEGWGVYAEQFMVEEGYNDNDPLQKLIALKWYLRSITNALMDQAIHVDGMTQDEAMELMIEKGFQEEREAALKWIRAQLTSAQLSTYFVGYQEHLDLRAEIEEIWAEEFTLRRYHDQLLSYGSPPVQFVRALMLEEPIPGD